ncbi:murC [Acrasis kona]|uniref:MurC n=1 Tax=Acrasis kona TaxID=1008807 RepID=A0AAW2Z8D4_9EUKA
MQPNTVPTEVLVNILEYHIDSAKAALNVSQVSKVWHTTIMGTTKSPSEYGTNEYYEEANGVWKKLYLQNFMKSIQIYKNAHNGLKIKNWYGAYKRRALFVKKHPKSAVINTAPFDHDDSDAHIIENCPEVDFLCPLKFEDLEDVGEYGARFCNQCKQKVYHCGNEHTLIEHVNEGHCVSYIKERVMIMGMMRPMHRF